MNKRILRFFPRLLLFILSPTRFIVECLKRMFPASWSKILTCWNLGFLGLSAVICIILWFVRPCAWPWPLRCCFFLWVVPFSRINEISYAFPKDAIQQLSGASKRTTFSPAQRLGFLASSYVEVALDFGIFYFFLPAGMFSKPFSSIIHAVYFSWVTITTTGYGDITPQCAQSQLLCMWELAVGLTLVVLAVGSYISSFQRSDKNGSHEAGETSR